MPFVSQAQRGWMYANEPTMAKKWELHTPKGKKLPKHVKKAMPYPFLIDIKLANLGVTNVGPASNALAGFGQAMMGSAPVSIPKQTNFLPAPSPQTPPILGGPTAGPGTPTSGGALPKAPTLGALQGMDRATNTGPATTSSSTSTVKTADLGSIFRPIANAAQKAVPMVKKVIPKVEANVPKALPQGVPGKALPYGADRAGTFHMDQAGFQLNPHTGARMPPSYEGGGRSRIPVPAGSTPPTAQVVHPPAAPAAPAATPTPAAKVPTPAAPPVSAPPAPSAAAPAPASVVPAPAVSKGNFWTNPLDASQNAATQGVARKGLNAVTRVITPGSTLSEAGRLAETSARGQAISPFFDKNRSWSTFAQQNLDSLNPAKIKQNLPGYLNAGAQITSLPSRLSGEAAFRSLASGSPSALGMKAPLWLAGGALYSGMSAGNNIGPDGKLIDPSRPMMHTGMGSQLLNPVTKAMDTLGIGDPVRKSIGVSGGAPIGYGSIDEPFVQGARGLKSLATNPAAYASVAGKGIANAGVGAFNAGKETGSRLMGASDAEVAANKTKLPFGLGDFRQDFRSIKGMPNPQEAGMTPPVSGAAGVPSQPVAPASPLEAVDKVTQLTSDMAGIDQQIAEAQSRGADTTMLAQQKQQMQQQLDTHRNEIMAHGAKIGEQAVKSPELQQQGVANLAKDLPEGTPPSFISGLWKIMQSNPWASGLMIAGLGIGALSMMGAFGNHNGIAAIAGLASTLVGAGMMPKEMWTQISAKLFGGPTKVPALAPGAAPGVANPGAPRAGVADPKPASGQNNTAVANDPNNVVPPVTGDNPFPMSPNEQRQIFNAPVLQRFFPGGKFSQDAVESFVMSGADSVPHVPGVVAALPPRIRSELKAKLEGSFWARRSQVGQALIAQL